LCATRKWHFIFATGRKNEVLHFAVLYLKTFFQKLLIGYVSKKRVSNFGFFKLLPFYDDLCTNLR